MNTNMTKAAIAIALVLGIGGVVYFSGMLSPVRGQTAALAVELAGEDGAFQGNSPARKASRATDLKNYTSDNNSDNSSSTSYQFRDNSSAVSYQASNSNAENYSSGDKFSNFKTNQSTSVAQQPTSTFSIDVDTASYTYIRNMLNHNQLPNKDAVRIEEMVNYFPYQYKGPSSAQYPFNAQASVFPSPWSSNKKLVHIGIKGYQLEQAHKPQANLVFLVDTSGSMNSSDKLPLLQKSLMMLLDSLQPNDSVAIVSYAGSAGVVLPPTKARNKSNIVEALNNLSSGGSTAGAAGIKTAYELAATNFNSEGVNRVILATDGDFNVGMSSNEQLKALIEQKRDSGIYLSILGFGMGNYNDSLMQTLAQNGNGNAAYIDSVAEARKVLVEEASSTLFTIAKDVKIQINFNPDTVADYRLVGYETRMLNKEDFADDKVDAGEIGAGHTVTAIYEITPRNHADTSKEGASTYANLQIRYKLPDQQQSKLISQSIGREQEYAKLDNAPKEVRFAAAVAAFGQLLRGEAKGMQYQDVLNLAGTAIGDDPYSYRSEFLSLVRKAAELNKGRSSDEEFAFKHRW